MLNRNRKRLKEREVKAEADIAIVTLQVTYQNVCEGKSRKMKRNQKNMRKAAVKQQNVTVSAKNTTKHVESECKGASSSSNQAYKTTSETRSEQFITFIVLQKNVRSLNSSERFEELTQEVEGSRWDAILISETWRASNAEIWETQHGHRFMGSGKFENKHGVGILVNKKWRRHIKWTDYISERAISTSIAGNKQHVLLMSANFLLSGYADHYVEKVYRSMEQLTNSKKKNIQIVGGVFIAEVGPGYEVEHISVGPHTLKEWNKRGDWMKQWLMIQNFTALNTVYRKTSEKQATNSTPKGTEKQLDYMLVDSRHLYCSRDAEANDMIHMGSDHRSVISTKFGSLTKNAHRQEEN